MTHLEVQSWRTNSELVQAMFDIHVWPKKWVHNNEVDVLDPTYGRGIWWSWAEGTQVTPSGMVVVDDFLPHKHGRVNLTGHDIRQDGVDYRALPEADESMDVVAFDPDYIAPGGRKTSTIGEFNDRYGLARDYESPGALQTSINSGVVECARVLRPQGIMLVKCTNYISSGKVWLGEHHTISAGLGAKLVVEDISVHLGAPGPQPERETRQQHLRSNSSRMIVFRKPGRRSKK